MLAEEIGPKGLTHHGSGDTHIEERVRRTWGKVGSLGENLSFGWERAEDAVAWMIVDDGVEGRGHRKNLFNAHYHSSGVCGRGHDVYTSCVVVVFFGEVRKVDKLEKYALSQDEWVPGAVNLTNSIKIVTQNNRRVVHGTYVFTLSNGDSIEKKKQFIE